MRKDANVMTANVIPVVDQSQTAAVEIPNPVSAVESYCKLLPTVLDEGALFQVISDSLLLGENVMRHSVYCVRRSGSVFFVYQVLRCLDL